MKISAIRSNVFRSNDESLREKKPTVVDNPVQKNRYQNIGLTGGLALACVGTSAVTGIAHARVPHIISSILAIGTSLIHVESIAIKNNRSLNYNA